MKQLMIGANYEYSHNGVHYHVKVLKKTGPTAYYIEIIKVMPYSNHPSHVKEGLQETFFSDRGTWTLLPNEYGVVPTQKDMYDVLEEILKT